MKVRVLVFSVLNVSELRVDVNKKLNETMHVQARCLSQDSTFDFFQFLSKFFSPKFELPNSGCDFSVSVAYMPMFMVYTILALQK